MDHPTLSNDQELDGYRLIRFLGRGGFGEVWLCRSGVTGSYHALKYISSNDPDLIEKEHHSLGLYRNAAAKLRSPHLVPIEHINRLAHGLYYVMPLADGIASMDPTDPAWEPLSMAALIDDRTRADSWFSSREIIALISPLLDALQCLSHAGLVHRDVKPDNILFFDGSPCLGDISLLGEDAAVITRRGTPGYATPSWYRGGHPDMYGVAACLYTLLTGNPPDKMGRAAFLWPPQGEQFLPESEQAEWKRLHDVIRRATEEKVSERYVDFRAMVGAIAAVGETAQSVVSIPHKPASKMSRPITWVAAGAAIILIGIGAKALIFPDSSDSVAITPLSPVTDAPTLKSDAQAIAYDNAQLAYNSLTWVQNDLPRLNLSSDQHNLFQDTLASIHNHTINRETFEPGLAVQQLDLCIDAIPGLREIPNVMLARLALLQAAGDTRSKGKEMASEVFSTLGTDNLAYRIQLLCRLDAADKAEDLLNKMLADKSLNVRKKSDMLVRRAELRAMSERYEAAFDDATKALDLASPDASLKAAVKMKLLRLENDYPEYAAHLKSHPQK